MKYRIDNAHREFFSTFRWIEFEELLTSRDLAEVNEAIDAALAARLAIPPERLNKQTPEALATAGRDIWRDSPRLQQCVCQRRFAEMMADLVEERPLRLAFDQAIVDWGFENPETPFASQSLETMSSLRGLVGGLILCLKDATGPDIPFFPKKAGNGICISPSLELPLNHIYHGAEQRYLIIAYGRAVTLFVHQSDSAYGAALRNMGYNYGDRLVDRVHPVVIR